MYIFKDKGGRELSLRPELTLPTMRFFANDMRNVPKPIKVYYFGNCFRYERPQSGRFREFWQYGAEIIGGGVYESDADIITLAVSSLENAGLKGFVIRIGHLGVLRAMLWEIGVQGEKQSKCMQLIDKKELDELYRLLSEQSPGNLGIERIKTLLELDKSPSVLEKAKTILRGNRKAIRAIEDLNSILTMISALGVEDYTIDLGIARGLDYYTGMVFEIDVPTLGAEKQVCGGGAYTLAELFGSEPTTSTGFAIGFDRVLMALARQETEIPIQRICAYVIPLGSGARNQAFKMAADLRKSGISCSFALLDRNISKHMKYANAIKARYVIIIGEDEMATKQATIKDMESGEQKKVAFEMVAEHIKTASRA
jgi:histidyl-tRNA synthetase